MTVTLMSLKPLSGLGCDGLPEMDQGTQVSACSSSVQSSEERDRKTKVNFNSTCRKTVANNGLLEAIYFSRTAYSCYIQQ